VVVMRGSCRVLGLLVILMLASDVVGRGRRGANRRSQKRSRTRCLVPGCKPGRCPATNRSACESCLTGWYLTEDAQCGMCPEGCRSCDAPGSCDACKKGYTKSAVTGTCQHCANHCDVCDQAGPGGCDECRDRHMLHIRLEPEADRVNEVHECLPCGKGCRSCTAEEGCMACDTFYAPLPKGEGCAFSFFRVLLVIAAMILAVFGCVYCLADEDLPPGSAQKAGRKADNAEVVRRRESATDTGDGLRSRHLVGYS